jgi:hypothetical protein
MTLKLDHLFSAVLVLCAVATTAILTKREFAPAAVSLAQHKPVFVGNWKSYMAAGIRIGSPVAPVQLIEFGDFECPVCGTFHDRVALVRKVTVGTVRRRKDSNRPPYRSQRAGLPH